MEAAAAGGAPLPAGAVARAGAPDAAVEHLARADPVMAALVAAHGPLTVEQRRRGRPTDPYGALLRSIVGQQLSVRAARAIYERLTEPFGGRAPSPAELLATDPERLRAAGLSRAKVAYLRDLAQRVHDGRLRLDLIHELPDDEVAAELVAVKGLGPWTAHMFLMFHLARPDVLPVGDVGLRRAARALYELPAPPGPDELTRLAEPWRPYRTLASLYLWASLDNEP
jgi:DNA-3-methyladenine glycosylase II